MMGYSKQIKIRFLLTIFLLLPFIAEGKKAEKRSAPSFQDHVTYFSKSGSDSWKKREQADLLRVKAINSIQKMVNGTTDKKRKFELYLRLGELLGERADYLRAVEVYNFEKSYDRWAKKKKGKEPKISHARSKKTSYRSVDIFKGLVKNYPKHARSDAALFALAKSLAHLGDKSAPRYFKKLIKSYPKSPLVPSAYFTLGEIYFDDSKLDLALDNYKSAIKYKNADSYLYAVYKLGWTYFNLGDKNKGLNYKKSLSAFMLVVKLSDRSRRHSGFNLRKQAINDLVMVWAETGSIDDAWRYFSKIKEFEAFYDVLEKLGNTYADQGKNTKAISAFKRLLKEAPHRERNPQIYGKLVTLYDQVNKQDDVVKSLVSMHGLYGVKTSVWIKAHEKNKELRKEASEKVDKLMHRYGALYHQRGQKSKRNGDLKTAIKIYQSYLQHYSKNENAYQIRYYLATLYEHFKMYEPASDEYLRVAKLSKKGKHFKEAAVNAVSAMHTLVQRKKWAKLPPLGKVKKPILVPREKKKLVSVIDSYVELLPKEKVGYPMRFTAADVYFKHGHYDIALQRYEKIVHEIPKSKEGKIALDKVLSFHTTRSEWPLVMKKARGFLKVKGLQGKKEKALITSHLKNAVFKQAVQFAEKKKHLEAARLFVSFQKEFPKDKAADKALFNASTNYYKIAEVDEALKVDKLLLKQYPKSPLRADVNLNIGKTYEGIANYSEAAKYYAMFSKNFRRDKRASAALFNAAIFYRGLKQYEVSLKYFTQFIRFYPKHKSLSDAMFEVAQISEKLKKYANAVSYYEKYLKKVKGISVDKRRYVEAKAAKMEYAYVDKKKGKRKIDRLARRFQKDKKTAAFEARRIVAGVLFNELNGEQKKFNNTLIKSPKTLEKDVKRKQGLLLKLASRYEGIIKVGSGEYTVASLYRLGEMHETFAETLFKAPSPKGVDQATINQYRSSIEQVAFPLKDEAYKYFETAYKRGSEVETFTLWTKMAYKKMAELFPKKHPEMREQAAKPAYLSHGLIWDDTVKELGN